VVELGEGQGELGVEGGSLLGLNGDWIVWVDPKTELPVRMQILVKNVKGVLDDKLQITLDEFEWDKELDPTLFSLEPPAGYTEVKPAAKPQVQKNYALLSDVQIAGIKERLKLSSDQESYWPGVEKALRAIARKIHSSKQADPASGMPPIDPDSDEVQQLKSAAMPLLFQLREDQKREVRALARIIGLEKVASMI
jgi:hypothetical protein